MKTIGRQTEQRSRGRLYHAEAGGTIYFVTFKAKPGESFNPAERAVILASCRHGHPDQWLLHGAVVMPDHVHMLLTPQPVNRFSSAPGSEPDFRGAGAPRSEPDFRGAGAPRSEPDFRGAGALTRQPRWISLSEIVKGIKSVTARKINHLRGRQRGSIWQDEYYDRSVRDQADFEVKLRYLMHNPIKQGLAAQPQDWDALWLPPKDDPAFRGAGALTREPPA
ncbi:MAG: hypothetical protein A2V67_13550 [Deltaproteobacteria bacterium RBG_13_61_14]|nr:MAG: hypothetical protein A2V67_13550 [Deltaproteobacteria bacterium RBG_13_61_14]